MLIQVKIILNLVNPPSAETKAKLSEAMTGERDHFFGRTHSAECKVRMSGANNPMYSRTGEKSPNSKRVFVYSKDSPTILSHEFTSCSEAAKHFSCHITIISKYLKNGKLFKNSGSYLRLTNKRLK